MILCFCAFCGGYIVSGFYVWSHLVMPPPKTQTWTRFISRPRRLGEKP